MQVDQSAENLSLCRCYSCPSYSSECKDYSKISYNDSYFNKLERLFCTCEHSHCIFVSRGCLCQTCKVYKKYNLHGKDYCLKI